MSILAQQLRRPNIKPKWHAPLGVMESVVAYNCRKYGFPVPVLAMPFWEGAGNKAYDIVNCFGSNIGTSMSWRADKLKTGTAYDDLNNVITLPVSTSPNINWTGLSVVVGFKTHPTAWEYPMIFALLTDWGEDGVGMENNVGTTNNIRFFTDTREVAVISSALSSSTYYNIAGTWDKINLRLYVNGTLSATQAETAAGWTPTNIQQRYINGINWGGTNWRTANTVYNYLYYFKVALTPAQVKFLNDNPYFMYEMPEELWGYAAAGGGYTLPVDSGSLALAGSALGLLAARKIPVASGSLTLAGTDIGTLKGSKIAASNGSLALSGQTVNLLADRIIAAASGALSLSGTGVGLLAFRKLLIASGSLALTGTDVNLIYTPAGAYILTASSGALSVAGSAVGLLAARKVPVASGSLTLSGTDVQTLKGSKITVGSGSLTLTGTDVDLLALRKLIATSGSLILTGTAVGLEYSGGAVPFPLLITISKSGEYTISILKDTEYDISILKDTEYDISILKSGGL